MASFRIQSPIARILVSRRQIQVNQSRRSNAEEVHNDSRERFSKAGNATQIRPYHTLSSSSFSLVSLLCVYGVSGPSVPDCCSTLCGLNWLRSLGGHLINSIVSLEIHRVRQKHMLVTSQTLCIKQHKHDNILSEAVQSHKLMCQQDGRECHGANAIGANQSISSIATFSNGRCNHVISIAAIFSSW